MKFNELDFKLFLKNQFNVVVNESEVSKENVLLYHEELDENLISKEILPNLPDPVMFQLFSYQNKVEWIVGVAIEAETYNPLFLVCLKDGTKVLSKLY